MNPWLLVVIGLVLVLRFGQAQATQIDPHLIGFARSFGDSKGASHLVEVWEMTNVRDGGKDYFLRVLPTIGKPPYAVIVLVNPYAVFPGPPSTNSEDRKWTSAIQKPGPYYDRSLRKEEAIIKCHTPTGECEIPVAGLNDLSDLASLGNVSGEGKANSHADWALTHGYVVVIAFARHYAARDTLTVTYDIAEVLVTLKTLPQIDGKRIGIIGRSQGGSLVVQALALLGSIFGDQFSIAAAVTEAAWIDGPKMFEYYFKTLPQLQPPHIFAGSLDFAVPFFHRLAKAFGVNPSSSSWYPITTEWLSARWPPNTPLLLLAGTDDLMVPVAQSKKFHAALLAKRRDVSIQLWENGDPPFASKTARQAGHGIMDANSPIKRGTLIRNFILSKMPPGIR